MKFRDIRKKGGFRFQFKKDNANGNIIPYVMLSCLPHNIDSAYAFVDMDNGMIVRCAENDFINEEIIEIPANIS